ncbi:MAG: GAF domain-containing sensor histidine kinase [Anaerolineales bacterium]|jgi:signal transduction histidine kinase
MQAAIGLQDGLLIPSVLSSLPIMAWLTDYFRRNENNEQSSLTNGVQTDRAILQLEEELDRMHELLLMTAGLNATLNVERVLEMTLDLANRAIEARGSSKPLSMLLLFENDQLYIASSRGLPAADMRITFPGERGALGETLANVQTRIVKDARNDPELKRMVSIHNTRVAICIPLVVGLELYGVLFFAHADPDFFYRERIELLDAIAQQAMIALQNAKLYRELEQEKERIAEIQEEARHKLARDLHDGPTQSIGAIAMRVNFARRLLQRDPQSASEELFKIEELARKTTKEIRQMLFTLRPLVLESEGLLPALEQLAVKMDENHDQLVIIEAKAGIVDDMEVGKQGVIFFIIEEAVNNARKHAQAEHIWVRMNRKSDVLHLEVEDDGLGFDVSKVQDNYNQRGSLGMVNLHERAELVNGILRIDSKHGRGTRVAVSIPMTMEAAERLHRPGYAA